MSGKRTKSPSEALNKHKHTGLYGAGPEGEAAWKNDVMLLQEMRNKMPRTLKP